MKLLDRYILGRFLTFLGFAIIASLVIFVTVDATEQLDKFIDAKLGWALILRYYYLYLPFILYLTLPVSVLLATLFTVGGLVYRNELTAMQSAGYSLWRVLTMLLLLALPLSGGALAIGETIVPAANHERKEIYRTQIRKNAGSTATRQGKLYMQAGRGTYLRMDMYDPAALSGRQVRLHTVEDGRIVRRVDADQIRYHGSGWMLYHVYTRDYLDHEVVKSYVDSLQRDDLGILPIDLERVNIEPEEMNYFDLRSLVGRLQASGIRAAKWVVDLAFKISQPFATFIIVLFGVPFAAFRRRGGLVLGFGLSLLVCFVYFGFIQVGKILGYHGTISPYIAAWSGNVLFGAIGLYLVVKVPK
ncbi:LptF/LptG family permease [candidate division KSB1 bacterium]|nr:LptF/LptG family permease [candidate division KSB1 bacterium]